MFDDQDIVDEPYTGKSESPPSYNDFQVALIEKCVVNRVYFAEVVLDVTLEDWQREVLQDLDNGVTRISIRSGNGAGKTCLLAIIILHYILFRNDVKIPVTAPSSGQLTDGLIPEVNKWMGVLPPFLRQLLDKTASRIVRKDDPENNFVSFRTARKEKPEALQGIHAKFVLCVVEEASGVDDVVYEAAEGTMSTPGAIFIMISNPTRLSGYFYNSHNRNKNRWALHHVTSFDTSRVDQTFVDNIKSTYGEDSNQYRVKVLGEFPDTDDESLISRSYVTAAFSRQLVSGMAKDIWGVDVGRGGDLSALVKRRGSVIHHISTKPYSDTMLTVGWVKKEWDDTPVEDRPEAIYVDVIGIGAGVTDRLAELGLPVVGVNVAETASLSQKYVRMRDELWYSLKAWFESNTCAIQLETDDAIFIENIEIECSTPLALFTSGGKDSVESKAQLRARGYRSPNCADAMCLTFSYQSAVAGGQLSTMASWNKELDYQPAAVH